MPRINIVIAGDAAKLNKELAKTERKMKRFASGMTTLGGGLFKAIGVPMMAVGAASVSTAVRFERMEQGLTAIMGSADAARKEMEKLRQVAQNPGLSYEQAVSGSTKLQAVGFSADQAREALSQFGNALALVGGTAADLDGVSLALTQIVSKGKVSAEEINQIAERVPQIRVAMQRALGTADTEKIQEMGLSSIEFISRVTSALGELPRASNTVSNSFDNLKQAADGLLDAIGKTLIQDLEIQRVVEGATSAINAMGDAFRNMSPAAKDAMYWIAGIGTLLGGGLWVGGKIVAAIAGISEAFRALGGTKVIAAAVRGFKALTTTGTTANIAVRMLAHGIKSVMSTLAAPIAIAAGALEGYTRLLTGNFGVVSDWIRTNFVMNSGMQKLALWWGALTGKIKENTDALKDNNQKQDDTNELAEETAAVFAKVDAYIKKKKEEEEDAAKFAEKVQKVYDELNGTLTVLGKKQKLFGGSLDPERVNAYESAIDDLLKLGYDPMSKSIQDLYRQIELLNAAMQRSVPTLKELKTLSLKDIPGVKSQASGPDISKMLPTITNRNIASSWADQFGEGVGRAAEKLLEFKEKYSEVFGGMRDVVGSFFSFKNAELEASYQRDLERLRMSASNEENFTAMKEKLDERYDKKRQKLQRKQAAIQKAVALMEIAINTASGVMATIGKTGIFGIPLSGLVLGMGAAQAALVAATPIPALAEGGMTTSAGYAMIGDNPSGKEFVIPYEKMGDFARRAMGGTNLNVSGEFRVKGTDLVLVLERQNRIVKNQRGYGING